MYSMLFILVLLPLFGNIFALTSRQNESNAYNVTLLTMGTGILIILKLFAAIDISSGAVQFVHQVPWLETMNITLSFGIDPFALLLLFGIYLSLLIGLIGLPAHERKNRSLFVLFLYFLWTITGFLTADDMISFYVFFAAMLIPLFMLIGSYGRYRKSLSLYLFFLINMAGILFLLISMLITYKFYHGNIQLHEIAFVKMPKHVGLLVWGFVCLAFASRIPAWPFHSWICAISAGIRNPLVYIMANLIPLTGLYGFARFWQVAVADSMLAYIPIVTVFCLITMFFIVLIGVVHKDFLYKLFSYMTVYYLLFLLTVILLSSILLGETLKMNMAYSLFIFLIVNASLVVLDFKLENECENKKCEYKGILAYMPRLSKIFSFFVLVAIGLPVSSMFWNNFIIISSLFNLSSVVGLTVMAVITVISLSLLYELYFMRDLQKHIQFSENISDLTQREFLFFLGIIVILFLSFFDPMWFVI